MHEKKVRKCCVARQVGTISDRMDQLFGGEEIPRRAESNDRQDTAVILLARRFSQSYTNLGA